MRLFFALWPSRETAAALHAWAKEVQHTSGGRVARAETIHLTLAFLGDVAEERLSALRRFRIKSEPRRLPIEQSRFWPHNRIVWVGPNETPEPLQVLVQDVRKTLTQGHFKAEHRAFAAHITLIRKARDPGELPPLPAVEWPVEELVLVRSRLSAAGSSYEVLQRYPLA